MLLRHLLVCVLSLAALVGTLPAGAADEAVELKAPGKLSVAVYNNFPPFSDAAKGIDADLGRALAERMGLSADVFGFNAGEEMADDLRNTVWKGHYLNGRTADVMLHVPVDPVLAQGNPQVKILGAYHREVIAIARNQNRVQAILGPAGLEAFTREKVGVEGRTISDAYLLGAFGGRLKENVVHFKTVPDAVKALRAGELAAVMAPLAELQGALVERPAHLVIQPFNGRVLGVEGWTLGMAVKKDAGLLAAALEKALASLIADGSVGKIFANYGVTWHDPAKN